MMSASSFRIAWEVADDHLVTASPDALGSIPMTLEGSRFLIEAGLPREAAPFLSFEALAGPHIPLVREVWHLPSTFPDYWHIGSNRSGDSIGIDAVGRVYAFNHDSHLRAEFISTSVRHLAETLLAYPEVAEATRGDEDAFLDGRIPSHLQLWFRERLSCWSVSAKSTSSDSPGPRRCSTS